MKYDTLILAKHDNTKIQKAEHYGVKHVVVCDDILSDQSINNLIKESKSPAIWISDVFVGKNQIDLEQWIFEKMLYNDKLHWWGMSHTGEYTEKFTPNKITPFAKPISIPAFDNELFLNEIKNVRHLFTNRHGNPNATWLSFTIHGGSYDQHQVSNKQPQSSFDWTPEACHLIPNITDYFKNLNMHDRYGLICIKLLRPGGFINLHIDKGFNQLPVNIAINNPSECIMHMWDTNFSYSGVVDFESTGAVELNVNKYHYVTNDSDTDRYHIIVHKEYT
jgi:hypothetical protein